MMNNAMRILALYETIHVQTPAPAHPKMLRSVPQPTLKNVNRAPFVIGSVRHSGR